MKLVVLSVLSLTLSSHLLCQGRRSQFWSLGGYGNVLFPGTGHAPVTPPGGVTGPYFSASPLSPSCTKCSRPPQLTVLPIPIYDNYSQSDSNQGQGIAEEDLIRNSAPAPSATIGQSEPPGNSNPRETIHSSPQPVPDEVPATIYFIALIDHSVIQALGYWREGGTLYYISADYGMNQISVSLIDRDLSERLNRQHGINFSLPAPK